MSNFQILIQSIFIKPHPNADSLELGNIGHRDGWQVVVKKDQFKTGNLVAYIGENAIVPDCVLKQYNFWNEGKNIGILSGKEGNRVRGIRLRNEFSLGICIPVHEIVKWNEEEATTHTYYTLNDEYVEEGEDVTKLLGVTKYEPPLPVRMAGQVFNAGTEVGVNYDIEDIKNFPQVIVEGEEVNMTVKVHGSNLSAVWLSPNISGYIRNKVQLDNWIEIKDGDECLGYIAVASKGQGKQGLFFKDNEENANNIYLKAFRPYMETFARTMHEHSNHECVTIVGEVFGKGIQNFDYGLNTIAFRCFDLYEGYRGIGKYVDDSELDNFCEKSGIPRVPVVYRGVYSFELLDKLANDKETEFDCKHVREGVIVKPVKERYAENLGRVALKHRSIAYLLKCSGEEFN